MSRPPTRPASPTEATAGSSRLSELLPPSASGLRNSTLSTISAPVAGGPHVSTGGHSIASYYQGRYDDSTSNSIDIDSPAAGVSASTSAASTAALSDPMAPTRRTPGHSTPPILTPLASTSSTRDRRAQNSSVGSTSSFWNPLDFSLDETLSGPGPAAAAPRLGAPAPAAAAPSVHAREESASSGFGGDMGNYRYAVGGAASPGASVVSLPLGGPLDFGASLAHTQSQQQQPQQQARAYHAGLTPGEEFESDGAFLTSHQLQRGYDQFGQRESAAPGGASGSSNGSPPPAPRVSYFGEVGGYTTTFESPRRVDSPSMLEDGGYPGFRAPSSSASPRMHRSSAEAVAAAGGDAPVVQSARSGLTRVGNSLRRISRRVIDLDGSREADEANRGSHIRLADVDEDADSSDEDAQVYAAVDDHEQEGKTKRMVDTALRGRSLGIWGPESKFRIAMSKLLNQIWVEPLILILIIANVVVLVLQSARSVFKEPRRQGYFDYYQDYILLGIFCVFTVEIMARIVVSGLIINPPPLLYVPPSEGDVPGSSGRVDGSEGLQTAFRSPDEIRVEQRRRMSQSNTLDTFAELGGTLRTRAAQVLHPDGEERRNMPRSPKRMNTGSTAFDLSRSGTVASSAFGTVHPVRPAPQRRLPSFSAESTLGQTTFATPPLEATAMAKDGSAADRPPKPERKTTLPFAKAILAQRAQYTHYAYLRHSWNRIDLAAVICFWISFGLAATSQEMTSSHHIYIFRALSVLRAARLLTITSGTTTILQSLKMASPLLVNVTFFTVFAMVLFSIIGIQSFKGSYRRHCVWVGDLATGISAQPGVNHTLSQICGGYEDIASGQRMGFLSTDGEVLSRHSKGYVCPRGLVCVRTDENPENDTRSFDDIFHSLLQVVIIISSNQWSQGLYDMVDAEPFVSCLFFIVGLIILNFWLANLFVAVITNTFATITASTKHSAFAAEKIEPAGVVKIEHGAEQKYRQRVANFYKRFWSWTKWVWLILVIGSLGNQAAQDIHGTDADASRALFIEFIFTMAFLVEFIGRFMAYVLDNDWRGFFARRRNQADLVIAVITCIIQIPPIANSAAYPWLTAFQLARFYRVVIAVPRMQVLLMRVFGSMNALMNMVLFLLLMVGLAALMAAQLFRGDVPQEGDDGHIEISFKHIYNSFLGMYQIFSSENWTEPLFNVLGTGRSVRQAVISGIFICAWFVFANFILLQMFIAVINENFGVAEGQKRAQQLEKYLQRMEKPPMTVAQQIIHKLSPYRWLRERNESKLKAAAKASGTSGERGANEKQRLRMGSPHRSIRTRVRDFVNGLLHLLQLDKPEEHVPLDTMRARQFRQSISGDSMLRSHLAPHPRAPSVYGLGGATHGEDAARVFARERQLTRMRSDLGLHSEVAPPQAEVDAAHRARHEDDPRIAQARLMNTHPSYEKSLWIFSSSHPFRRFCQSIVPSSYGERLFGRSASRVRHTIYQLAIFLAIIASISVAAIATPAYRRDWYRENGLRRDAWFSITEASLSFAFVVEFAIKVIADGFAFTPNAYMLSAWNALDLFVLGTLITNVTTEMAVIGGVSRFTRALKAARALRLINLSSLMRHTFHGIMAGMGAFFGTAVLAILYIVPYAVWGQNLFAGLLYSCNDSSPGILRKSDCFGEFSASPSEWDFLAPRVWDNPTQGTTYSFDSFSKALLVLFEIVSLEGWTSVMGQAMSITGRDMQPQPDAMQINAIFFLIYNLIGAVFVLTLFVSVIIENFQTFSGAAFQTTEQRQWVDLKRLIARQKPAKRPKVQPRDPIRKWCFDRATAKHGWWSRGVTMLYIINVILLATQQFKDSARVEGARDVVYLIFSSLYAIDILVRLAGVGGRAFRDDLWNIYDVIVVLGVFATTLALLSPKPGTTANLQLQKLFLTAVAFKLVQRSNALNALFRTAIASLPAIGSLFALWLVFFITFSIMFVEVFGLTRWGENESYSKNFSTFFGAMVFLSMMSTGENWNQFMHDFTLSPPDCTPAASYLDTDCGSEAGALILFIAWNVISMYLFLNMFTGTVVENFSYVFQLGGKPMLSREQVRSYKKTWAQFDRSRKGYVQKEQLVPLLNDLNGVLEVRVYPAEGRISTLRAAASPGSALASPTSPSKGGAKAAATNALNRMRGGSPSPLPKEGKGHFMWPPSPGTAQGPIVAGVDIDRLRTALSKLDGDEIKRRRRRFERIYQEACMVETPGKGISFTALLMILAHYKLIDDEEALSLEELIDRRMLLEQVESRIEMERVRGMLRQTYLRNRFLAMLKERDDAARGGEKDIPIIQVDEPSSGNAASRNRPELSLDLSAVHGGADSQTHTPTSSIHLTPSPSPTRGRRPAEVQLEGSNSEHPSITLSSAAPSPEEASRRAARATSASSIESFERTAWGAVARRQSDAGEVAASPSLTNNNPWSAASAYGATGQHDTGSRSPRDTDPYPTVFDDEKSPTKPNFF